MCLTRRWVLVFTFVLLPWSAATAEEAADLSLTKTASPSPVQATTTLSYGLNVFNQGPAVVATGVQVTDTLPPGVTLVSATTTQGTCSAMDPVVCTVGNLTMGAVV